LAARHRLQESIYFLVIDDILAESWHAGLKRMGPTPEAKRQTSKYIKFKQDVLEVRVGVV
jgi:hypothetical protein